jgi:hypothetical protein
MSISARHLDSAGEGPLNSDTSSVALLVSGCAADHWVRTPIEERDTGRALYPRKRGRDLFDLWFALEQGVVEASTLISCFNQREIRSSDH